MVKIIDDYPGTVSIAAASIANARAWAKKKGYIVNSVESSRLTEKKRKDFFGTTSKVYIIAKRGRRKSDLEWHQ